MRSALPMAFATAAIAGVAATQAPASTQEPWNLTEVARSECRGGLFFNASFSADSTRMLTIGEEGVAIEWDLEHARESKRFTALAGAFAVHMHPRDPWAIVLAGREPTRAHRLDFGTGRYTELWSEPVSVVAFDATGARAAVVFVDATRGSRLAVYPEAALRTTPPLPPDFERDFPGERLGYVFFHPRTGDVYATCRGEVLRVLPGGTATATTPGLCGFLADGTEVVETRGRPRPVVAGEHWLAGNETMERGGASPCQFSLAANPPLLLHPNIDPAIAADGTVVAPDETGLLHLLGPAPDRRRTLRGQPGPTLQVCFDASGRYLAIVGGCVTTILDSENGTSARFDGTFALQASSIAGEFTVLEASSLSTMRANDGHLTTIARLAPATATARSFERNWTIASGLLQFLWLPKAEQLWLAQVDAGIRDPYPARFHDGTLTAIALPHAPDESPFQLGLGIGAGRDGQVVLATTTRPMTCGSGLGAVRFWSALRTYDRDGRQLCAQPLAHALQWMRTSPAGALVAVPANETKAGGNEIEGKVGIYTTHDLKPMHELALGAGPIVAWQFVDEHTALASNGKSLLLVQLAAGTAKEIPVALPGAITQLAVSRDGKLVAIACGSDVRVLRRR